MAYDVRYGYQIVQKWDNWALLDKGEQYGDHNSRWIAAHYPHYDKDGNSTSWEHGHYFNSLFDAVCCVEAEINNSTIVQLSSKQREYLTDYCVTDIKSRIEYMQSDPEKAYLFDCFPLNIDEIIELIKVLGEPDRADYYKKELEEIKDHDFDDDIQP